MSPTDPSSPALFSPRFLSNRCDDGDGANHIQYIKTANQRIAAAIEYTVSLRRPPLLACNCNITAFHATTFCFLPFSPPSMKVLNVSLILPLMPSSSDETAGGPGLHHHGLFLLRFPVARGTSAMHRHPHKGTLIGF